MHYNVLIVDDEKELSEYTARFFNMSGVSAYYVLDAASAEEFLENNSCSLILLDINLGEDSGFLLCQKIRSKMNIPIFFISARQAEDDMLLALGLGGDDYICKPYSLSILIAKVKAYLKRYEDSISEKNDRNDSKLSDESLEEGKSNYLINIGSAVINLRKASVIKDDKEVFLKAMEYKLLVYLINNKNRVISKDELFEKVWKTEYVGDVTLNVHIRHLREKIEDDAGNPKYIKTVWGVGFMLEDN